jgi:uncharacterized protein
MSRVVGLLLAALAAGWLALTASIALAQSTGTEADTGAETGSELPADRVLPAPESDTVTDFARILPAAEEARIVASLQAIRDETGVQMVVVTMPDLALYGGRGMRLDAYAKALFNAWGVGGADRNDGILMLVDTGAREVRIALGAGYDAVYDGRAARVLTTAVLPEFREDRLVQGIEAGIASSRDRLIAPFLAGLPVSVTDGFETEQNLSGPALALTGIIAALAGIIGLAMRGVRKRKTCPKCGAQTLNRTQEVIEPATRLSSGTGIEHLHCTSCGYVDRQSYTIRKGRDGRDRLGGSRGRSGGRSGGFGGGRSSGGGASGKW